MAYTVHITKEAAVEIDEALGWYAERSISAAVRWCLKLHEAIRSLEDNPRRYGLAPEDEWYDGELRQMLYGKKRGVYRVLYEIQDDVVYVVRVRHAAQDLLKPGDL